MFSYKFAENSPERYSYAQKNSVFLPSFSYLCSCSHVTGEERGISSGQERHIQAPKPVVVSPYKVKVAEVFNDTHKVFDVDVIGLLWNGIEDSLKKRGMLWTPNAEGEPYVMEGHVVYFKKGGMAERFLPRLGDTVAGGESRTQPGRQTHSDNRIEA